MRGLLLAALIAGSCAAEGQIVELSAGASTAYDAGGASVHLHTGSLDAQAGIGLASGQFAAGGAAIRTIRNGSVTVGEQELKADVPTDVFDTRHTLFGTGVGLRQESNGRSLAAFAGFTSIRAGTPFFPAAQLGQSTFFSQSHARLGSACGQTLTGIGGGGLVALASLDCTPRKWLALATTLGVGADAPYAAASAVVRLRDLDLKAAWISASDRFQRGNDPLQPTPEPIRGNLTATWRASRALQLSGARGSWTMPSSQTGVEKSAMDSAGIGWEHRDLSVSATLLHSTFADGTTPPGSTHALSASLRYRAGRVDWSETLLHAAGSSGLDTTIASTAFSVQPTAHLRVSEGINVTAQGVTFSHGGTLLTSFSSFDVDYQFYYVANRPDRPFQQALLVHAEMPLPGRFSVSASSSISPTGTPMYTFQISRVLSREPVARTLSVASLGQSVLRGHVQQPDGRPVARAALLIGDQRVYSDDAGDFTWREPRPRSHAFRVLTEEFVSADIYTLVEAPSEVRSGEASLVRIVVRREPRLRPSQEPSKEP